MKTIEVNIYKFSELSEDIKEKVINKFRENEDFGWFISEANKSFEKFADIFSLDWRYIDYCEPYRNEYSININEDILNLSGQRLAKHIWNNYKDQLYKGKYYSLWSKKDVPYKHYKEGYPVLKSRHSKIFLDNCCVLTGVCYDDDLLKPIYDFLDKPSNITFETLLNDCIYSLCHSVESEIEYRSTDEAIIEDIEVNDYEFLYNGQIA